jgi:hypothetical protein
MNRRNFLKVLGIVPIVLSIPISLLLPKINIRDGSVYMNTDNTFLYRWSTLQNGWELISDESSNNGK